MTLFIYTSIFFLGLMIGSFLNVIIYRLPIMLKQAWRAQSCELLNQPDTQKPSSFNLCIPRSHCPLCQTPLNIKNLIPLFSFLFLKGRCHACKNRISYRYPAVELLAGITAVISYQHFGATWAALGICLLSFGLIVASAIDIAEQFIPDSITFFLLWLGLLANAFFIYTTPTLAILGTILGYSVFWSIARLFLWIRKKEGLGHGDFKLLAMLGAWLGPAPLLDVVLLASLSGVVVSLLLISCKKLNPKEPIPFGPFLALGGWCTMMFGSFITHL